jgi:putative transposase
LLARIKAIIAEMPTYGYRRVHAILRRDAAAAEIPPAPNHKRVWRVMHDNGLLLIMGWPARPLLRI